MSQSHSIEDVDDIDPTVPEEVERRVADWLRRIDDLYAVITDWAAGREWAVAAGAPVDMNERPMRRFGIRSRPQPSLVLRPPGGGELWIKPKALWVIGANGRIDLYSGKGVYVLVDVADPFEAPRWMLHRVGAGHGDPFRPDLLATLT